MSARTEHTTFTGLAGDIDCALDWPSDTPRGWALVLHPHPLHGGARDNKVVTTISRSCVQHGLLAVRPNFRGVGASNGQFDNAKGETADMLELVKQFEQRYPEIASGPWVLGGFSFGTAVAAQLYSSLTGSRPQALILTGTAAQRFTFLDIALPDDTLLVHGETDEVVPLDEAMDFARQHELPMVVIPDASHFFHGKLLTLRQLVQQRLALL
ncbi:MAG TPA: alpha/beta hydrolase [Pusillimonas sp.]|uniref:alpha/beta hydrolase n=1 Tax=Pusillimonas sp. TaxID=3040095 RepID=UPI002B7F5CBF|nr:alpha/beta hydrolase [Pusillimonas sp.]HUH86532.1 alpha/beta hydrolase [Pusillimonas sp.]